MCGCLMCFVVSHTGCAFTCIIFIMVKYITVKLRAVLLCLKLCKLLEQVLVSGNCRRKVKVILLLPLMKFGEENYSISNIKVD